MVTHPAYLATSPPGSERPRPPARQPPPHAFGHQHSHQQRVGSGSGSAASGHYHGSRSRSASASSFHSSLRPPAPHHVRPAADYDIWSDHQPRRPSAGSQPPVQYPVKTSDSPVGTAADAPTRPLAVPQPLRYASSPQHPPPTLPAEGTESYYVSKLVEERDRLQRELDAERLKLSAATTTSTTAAAPPQHSPAAAAVALKRAAPPPPTLSPPSCLPRLPAATPGAVTVAPPPPPPPPPRASPDAALRKSTVKSIYGSIVLAREEVRDAERRLQGTGFGEGTYTDAAGLRRADALLVKGEEELFFLSGLCERQDAHCAAQLREAEEEVREAAEEKEEVVLRLRHLIGSTASCLDDLKSGADVQGKELDILQAENQLLRLRASAAQQQQQQQTRRRPPSESPIPRIARHEAAQPAAQGHAAKKGGEAPVPFYSISP